MTKVLVEDLKIVNGEDQLALYQWASKTTKYFFYLTYDIHTRHQRLLNLNKMSFNVATIEGLHPQDFENISSVECINH